MNPTLPGKPLLQGEEKRLVESACSGNTQAFAALYDRYAPVLLGVLVQWVSDSKKAEEILERTFVQLGKEMQAPAFVADRVYIRALAIARELAKKDIEKQETKNIRPGGNLKALELVYFKGYRGAGAAAQLGLTITELKAQLRAELSVYRSNKK